MSDLTAFIIASNALTIAIAIGLALYMHVSGRLNRNGRR